MAKSPSKPSSRLDGEKIMSRSTFDRSLETIAEHEKSHNWLRLTERLCNVSHFLLRLQVQFQFGRHSRASLHLLRMEIIPEKIEFDCITKSSDPWETDPAEQNAKRRITLQVLHDAIDLRAILFRSVPDVDAARIRIYRNSGQYGRELIMVGHTHRNDQSALGFHSPIVRAKVLGYQFRLDNDYLKEITEDPYASVL